MDPATAIVYLGRSDVDNTLDDHAGAAAALAAALASAAAVASDEDINQSAVRNSDSGVELAVEQEVPTIPRIVEDDAPVRLK